MEKNSVRLWEIDWRQWQTFEVYSVRCFISATILTVFFFFLKSVFHFKIIWKKHHLILSAETYHFKCIAHTVVLFLPEQPLSSDSCKLLWVPPISFPQGSYLNFLSCVLHSILHPQLLQCACLCAVKCITSHLLYILWCQLFMWSNGMSYILTLIPSQEFKRKIIQCYGAQSISWINMSSR